MEAKAVIKEIERISSNNISVRISISISNVHLKLVNKNDKKTTCKNKTRYSFFLTGLPPKSHITPDDALGECMETHEQNPVSLGLSFLLQKQWCVDRYPESGYIFFLNELLLLVLVISKNISTKRRCEQ